MNKIKNRVGEIHMTKEGEKIKIIEYFCANNCTIQFIDGSVRKNIKYCHIKSGSVLRHRDRIGEKHTNNQGCKFEIIEWFGCKNCTIKFENGYILKKVEYSAVVRGFPVNPLHPSVCGVGYTGIGKYLKKVSGTKEETPEYTKWSSIIRRCYSEKALLRKPTYKEVTVDARWHNFQVFAQWYEENWKPDYMEGWHLDKDILVKGNKMYSPETCCFVPHCINIVFAYSKISKGGYIVGVCFNKKKKRFETFLRGKSLGLRDTPEETFELYKIAKEKDIKNLADEWKLLIHPDTYSAMYNWIVEITD